jgi:hypothetical protein
MTGKRKFKLHSGKSGAAITIRVTPRMAKNEIHDIMDDGTVKIRLTAPPVDGKANKELVRFLSEILDVPIVSIEIIAGLTGHDKIVSIVDMDSDQVQQRILAHLATK